MASLEPLSQPVRWAALGAVSLGVIGATAGLIIGFFVHWPTALFAIVELGLPATIVGGVIGLILGAILAAGRRIFRNDR